MPRQGTGETTDNLVTRNRVREAGDSWTKTYTFREGSKSSSPIRDVSGYAFTVKAILLTGEDTDNLTVASGKTPFTLPAANVGFVDDGTDGQVFVYFPTSLLDDVGLGTTDEPTIGGNVYVGFTITYSDGSVTRPTVKTFKKDVIIYEYNIGFDIT